jgi:hypothetical protein
MAIDETLYRDRAIRAPRNEDGSGSMRRRCGLTLRTFQKAVGLCTAIPILTIAAVSCGRVREQGQHAAVGVAFQFGERIGWLHGACLAISNPNLANGTPVVLVITGEPQKVQQARIQAQTNSPATCQALMEGRAKLNAKPGMSFYALETESVGSTDMGFGIVAPPANPVVVNGQARVDLDQDGRSEVFSSCATSEGIKFAVWTEKAYQGDPRWSGYYYLDYESTPTCP